MEETFIFLKCNAVDDLIFLFELTEKREYEEFIHNGVEAYIINLNHTKSKMMIEAIKDINIFFPKANTYISDFLLLRKTPTKEIIDFINHFKADDLFLPYISDQRMRKIRNKILNNS